ncbi:MAG TPA: hypothetical protein VFB54_03730, partial [Burkholderiales bacterium]|nr:hypothetical protein [Burkholderiales bacterium]
MQSLNTTSTSMPVARRVSRFYADPGRLVAVMLAIAAVLSMIMAMIAAINDQPQLWSGPPDEYLHRGAARYYEDQWLPPKVGTKATLDSYSRDYGFSYLNDTDPVYLLAGKFARLTGALFSRDDLAFRAFDALLLAVLAALCAWRPRSWLVFAPLLLTPQIWYIFSYFNGDAFPLFVSMLIAYQVAVPESLFNRYLDAPGVLRRIIGIVPLAAAIALVALSKKNYYVFLAFIPAAFALLRFGPVVAACMASAVLVGATAYLKWIILGVREIAAVLVTYGIVAFVAVATDPVQRAERTRIVVKCAAMILIATMLVVWRYWLDVEVQGSLEAKNAAIGTVQEQLAKPDYKPSHIYGGNPETFRGFTLRWRGVPLAELFEPPWNWHKAMFLSSTGHYGWLELRSPTPYYVLLGAAYAVLILYLTVRVARSRDGTAWVGFGLLLTFAALCVGISLWHAWENDFQAQGRYLFPIAAMLGVFLHTIRRHL